MPEEPAGRRTQRPSRKRRRPEKPLTLPRKQVTFRYPPESGPCDDQPALELLAGGTLTVEGRLVAASNATLYCMVELDGQTAACVYKPVAGERPLWISRWARWPAARWPPTRCPGPLTGTSCRPP